MAGFWRPGADVPSTSAPSTLLTLDVDAYADATGTLIRFEKNPKASLSTRRRALPIAAHAHELMYCVETSNHGRRRAHGVRKDDADTAVLARRRMVRRRRVRGGDAAETSGGADGGATHRRGG